MMERWTFIALPLVVKQWSYFTIRFSGSSMASGEAAVKFLDVDGRLADFIAIDTAPPNGVII